MTTEDRNMAGIQSVGPRWKRVGGPNAGLIEARWAEAYRPELVAKFANQWVAILGEVVVESAATFEELHAKLTQTGITNAFVQLVPSEPEDSSYLIA
jgi:hypothetical protein